MVQRELNSLLSFRRSDSLKCCQREACYLWTQWVESRREGLFSTPYSDHCIPINELLFKSLTPSHRQRRKRVRIGAKSYKFPPSVWGHYSIAYRHSLGGSEQISHIARSRLRTGCLINCMYAVQCPCSYPGRWPDSQGSRNSPRNFSDLQVEWV